MIEDLKKYWPHDDTPGYSDYPEADIRAHRSNAKWARRLGMLIAAAGVLFGAKTGDASNVWMGLAWGLLGLWASANLRLQALEWEVKLQSDNGEQSDP